MPSGRTHRRIDLIALGALIAVAIFFQSALTRQFGQDRAFEYCLVFVGTYLFSTSLLSPDLDLGRSEPTNNWGLFRSVWLPYSALFKHRGVSHSPFLGPLVRILYLAAFIYILLAFLNTLLDMGWKMSIAQLTHFNWAFAVSALGGLWVPNLLHILVDRLSGKRR